MINIGIVCEGPRDYDMLKSVISCFYDKDYNTLFLQPNQEFGTDNGSGWKGVIRWLQNHSSDLNKYLTEITPSIDLLIIQMDADVARCEKEIYCKSIPVECIGQAVEDYLNCSIIKVAACPQLLPPNAACDGTSTDRIRYIKQFLKDYIKCQERIRCVITVPCDATDAWIIAAFEEDMEEIEQINEPWSTISHKKEFHGIRIPGHKKSKRTYDQLIDRVCQKWDVVKQKCTQALLFENDCKTELFFDNTDSK